MLAFKNGDICLYDDENDMNPFKFKTNLKTLTKADWNVNGDCFAVCGFMNEGDTKGCVSFYNSIGKFIKLIKINEPIVCFSFNAKGTQIALETQNTIYFGIVKQKYKWCYFGETLVYAFLSDQEHHTVTFWNTKNNTFNYITELYNQVDIELSTQDTFDYNVSGTTCNIIFQFNKHLVGCP